MRKKWFFCSYDKERVAALSEDCGIDALTALLLSAGGMSTPEAVLDFLNRERPLTDPFLLKDMDRAVSMIQHVMEEGGRICIYGDYDADGVSATALLYSYLDAMGADVTYYIPSRMNEGYGLHIAALEKIAANGADLVISVDTGITAVEAAERAMHLGLKLVITDHHKPADTLPEAAAVVDPHRADDTSGLHMLAGVGVALALVAALEGGWRDDLLAEYAQFAAIGTIADIMPLVGDNRRIVIAGLEQMNQSPLPGLQALLQTAGLAEKTLTAGHVAFGIAPRINAAGRMGSAETALRLLMSETAETASYYAAALERYNEERHQAERAIGEAIEQQLLLHPAFLRAPVLVADGEGWHEGVLGIAASRLVEKYGKPAVVITRLPDGSAKGSCRGIEDFSIYDALCACEAVLTHFGGHTSAAGLGIQADQIPQFREKINDYAKQHMPSAPRLSIFCKLNPAGVSLPLLHSLENLEPFGAGNPRPVFAFCSMKLLEIIPIGGGKHLRLRLIRQNTELTAVYFGVTEKEFPFAAGDLVDVAAVVEKNEYNGVVRPSVQVKSIRFAGTDDDALFESYQNFRLLLAGFPLTEPQRAAALPPRAFIETVYRYIKRHGEDSLSEEVLLKRIGAADSDFCRLLVALHALADCGLIRAVDGGWQIIQDAEKVDLKTSPWLSALGYSE